MHDDVSHGAFDDTQDMHDDIYNIRMHNTSNRGFMRGFITGVFLCVVVTLYYNAWYKNVKCDKICERTIIEKYIANMDADLN